MKHKKKKKGLKSDTQYLKKRENYNQKEEKPDTHFSMKDLHVPQIKNRSKMDGYLFNSIKMDGFPSERFGGNQEEKNHATPNAKPNRYPIILPKYSNPIAITHKKKKKNRSRYRQYLLWGYEGCVCGGWNG